jgi:hypothetical protein
MNSSDMYFGSALAKSQLEYQLFGVFHGFPSLFSPSECQDNKLGHNCFPAHRFPLFVNCVIIPRCVVSATNIINSNEQKPVPSQHMMKEHIQRSKINVSVNTCMTNDLTIDGH